MQNGSLFGSVERITFQNPENGYCVLKVLPDNQKAPITITATLPAITIGERVECFGEWVAHHRFGEQFQAHTVHVKRPSDVQAIEKYLSSGVIKGIREGSAKKLVAAFKENTLEVINEAIEALRKNSTAEVEVIKKAVGAHGKKWERIKEGLLEYAEAYLKYAQERVWLTSLGLGAVSSQKLLKEFGDKVITVTKRNPYSLIEKVKGFGFLKSDDIALKLGVPPDSSFRVKAGITHLVKESALEGHCYIEVGRLLNQAVELLALEETVCFERLKELVTEDSLMILPQFSGLEIMSII